MDTLPQPPRRPRLRLKASEGSQSVRQSGSQSVSRRLYPVTYLVTYPLRTPFRYLPVRPLLRLSLRCRLLQPPY
eukprot:864922-Pyramimonas_sp.AAC.1